VTATGVKNSFLVYTDANAKTYARNNAWSEAKIDLAGCVASASANGTEAQSPGMRCVVVDESLKVLASNPQL
jgi:hypothetical protein